MNKLITIFYFIPAIALSLIYMIFSFMDGNQFHGWILFFVILAHVNIYIAIDNRRYMRKVSEENEVIINQLKKSNAEKADLNNFLGSVEDVGKVINRLNNEP